MSAENWKLAAMAINDPSIRLYRVDWPAGAYIRFSEFDGKWITESEYIYYPDFGTVAFKIYEEPKKKKKLYKYAITTSDSAPRWYSFDSYFESEDALKSYCAGSILELIRRDDTMIEVDE